MTGLLNVDYNLEKHFMLTSANEVFHICKPLFDLLGINYFSMHRVYADGYRGRLTTNAQWLEHYYSSKLYQNARLERHPSLYGDSYTLWDEWPKNDDSFFKVHKHMKDLYNRDHGFSIIRNYEMYMDVFILTAPSEDTTINFKYIQHLEDIKKFLAYFMIRGSYLIDKLHHDRFKIDLDDNIFNSDDGSSLQLKYKLRKFYEGIYLKNIKINTPEGPIELTKRETDCISLLLKLKGAKEIAKELNLSPRTIESYLNAIKNKLQVNSISSLIKKIVDSNAYPYLNSRHDDFSTLF